MSRSAQRDLALPADHFTPFAGVFSGVLDGFAGGMTGVPGQDQVGGVANTVAGGGRVPRPPVPDAQSRADNPFQTVSGDLFDGAVGHALEVPGTLLGGLGAGSARDLPTGDLPLARDPAAGGDPAERDPAGGAAGQ